MKNSAIHNLSQLKMLLKSIDYKDYLSHPDVLSGASIGQHIRHILEFYQLLITGSPEGEICYDNRSRDPHIENDIDHAIDIIDQIVDNLGTLKENTLVKLKADYTSEGDSENLISSSVGRELAYCIEHSIHHQALIKTGLISLGLKTLIDDDFGVAYSTIRFRKIENNYSSHNSVS